MLTSPILLDFGARWLLSVHRTLGASRIDKAFDVEHVITKGFERHIGVNAWIISDNGLQFVAKHFNAFVCDYCPTHAHQTVMTTKHWQTQLANDNDDPNGCTMRFVIVRKWM